MKICFISDIHGRFISKLSMPDADVIVFTGDFSMNGSQCELESFFDWFSGLIQYKEKIFIAGNHDFICEKPDVVYKLIPDSITYLFDNSVTIDGIKFYGTPWQPIFFDWSFNLDEEKLFKLYELIPEDTDILLTHTPPFGILDKTYDGTITGSSSLSNRINIVKPKISAFGHIHEAYGILEVNGVTYVNSSLLDRKYRLVNEPIIIEI